MPTLTAAQTAALQGFTSTDATRLTHSSPMNVETQLGATVKTLAESAIALAAVADNDVGSDLTGDQAVAAVAAAAVSVTSGGTPNAGKILKADAAGKLGGKDVATLGTAAEGATAAAAAAVSTLAGGAGNDGKLLKCNASGGLDGISGGAMIYMAQAVAGDASGAAIHLAITPLDPAITPAVGDKVLGGLGFLPSPAGTLAGVADIGADHASGKFLGALLINDTGAKLVQLNNNATGAILVITLSRG